MRKIVFIFGVLFSLSSYLLCSSDFLGGIYGKSSLIPFEYDGYKNKLLNSFLVGKVEFLKKESYRISLSTGISNYSTESSLFFTRLPFSIEKESSGISDFLIGSELKLYSLKRGRLYFGGLFGFSYFHGEEKRYQLELNYFKGNLKITSNLMNAKVGPFLEYRKRNLEFSVNLCYSFLYIQYKAMESIGNIVSEQILLLEPESDIILSVEMKYTIKNFIRFSLIGEVFQMYSIGMGVDYVF